MKIRKQYTLFINPMLGTAYYGNGRFGRRIYRATLGLIYDCNFSELKHNLQDLQKRGYSISPRNY